MSRALLTAYALAVVAVAVVRALTGAPHVATLALTPDRLAAGHVWLLATSAVIVNGPALPQVAALLPTLAAAARHFGAAFVVAVMVLAHVGATLLTYAGLLVLTGDVDGPQHRSFDYGTSAVWLGLVGALAVAAWRPARRGALVERIVVVLAAVAFVIAVTAFGRLSSTEHACAFALGAAAAVIRERRSGARRSARSGATTASSPAASA